MAKTLHKEDIKSDIRKRHGSLVAFERKRDLPAGSVKDVLRKRSVAGTELAIANELKQPLHVLFPWRYAPLVVESSTKEDSASIKRAHRQIGGAV